MDERSQRIVAQSMGVTLGLVYLLLFVSCIWKYVTTGDITNSTWELILIVMIPASIWWFARKDENLLIPRMSGTTQQEIPTELDDKTRKRRKKYYFWDALGLATVFLILNFVDSLFIQKSWDYFILFPQWSHKLNIVASLALEFILSVIIFYLIAYIWGEWQSKKYNQKINELEDIDE